MRDLVEKLEDELVRVSNEFQRSVNGATEVAWLALGEARSKMESEFNRLHMEFAVAAAIRVGDTKDALTEQLEKFEGLKEPEKEVELSGSSLPFLPLFSPQAPQ